MRIVLTPTGLRCGGRVLPCSIGRGGVTVDKREGDGATSAGVLRIVDAFYRPDRMARPSGWAKAIGPRDLWSDDPADPAYNTLVRAPYGFGHERLARSDPQYDLFFTTDWNTAPPVPGKGSAIFIHIRKGPGLPTAGCIALARPDLMWLAPHLAPGTAITVPAALAARPAPST
ncbi:L,D-transpeptidase family protein [Rhodobacterales bacterium HKCCE2091]|nr:L,D-transpeptidase family protein [Rhodobacterales bacterium HKCCE2091]